MKVPVSWLREYVSFDVPLDQLAAKLVLTSVEVDRIVRRGVPDLDGNLGLFRVGKVLEAGKHPNADRLQLCQVDVGEGDAAPDRLWGVELRSRRDCRGRACPAPSCRETASRSVRPSSAARSRAG